MCHQKFSGDLIVSTHMMNHSMSLGIRVTAHWNGTNNKSVLESLTPSVYQSHQG